MSFEIRQKSQFYDADNPVEPVKVTIVDGDPNNIIVEESGKISKIKSEDLHELITKNDHFTKSYVNVRAASENTKSADAVHKYNMSLFKGVKTQSFDTENFWQVIMPPSKRVSGEPVTFGELLKYHMSPEEIKEFDAKVESNQSYKELMLQTVDADSHEKLASLITQYSSTELDGTILRNNSILVRGKNVQSFKTIDGLGGLFESGIGTISDLAYAAELVGPENRQYLEEYVQAKFMQGDPYDFDINTSIKEFIQDYQDRAQVPMQTLTNSLTNPWAANANFDILALAKNGIDVRSLSENTNDTLNIVKNIKRYAEPLVISSEVRANFDDFSSQVIQELQDQLRVDDVNPLSNRDFLESVKERHASVFLKNAKKSATENVTVPSQKYKASFLKASEELDLYIKDSSSLDPATVDAIQEAIEKTKREWAESAEKLKEVKPKDVFDKSNAMLSSDWTGTLSQGAEIEYMSISENMKSVLQDTVAEKEQLNKLGSMLSASKLHTAATDTKVDVITRQMAETYQHTFLNDGSGLKTSQAAVYKGTLMAKIVEDTGLPTQLQKKLRSNIEDRDLILRKHNQDMSDAEATVGSISKFMVGSAAVALGSMVTKQAETEREKNDVDKPRNDIITEKYGTLTIANEQKTNPIWATGAGVGLYALMHSLESMPKHKFNDVMIPVFDRMFKYVDEAKVSPIKATGSLMREFSENVGNKINTGLNKVVGDLGKGWKSYVDNFDDAPSMKAIGIGAMAALAVVGISGISNSIGKDQYQAQESANMNDYRKTLTGELPINNKVNTPNEIIESLNYLKPSKQQEIPLTERVPMSGISEFVKKKMESKSTENRYNTEEEDLERMKVVKEEYSLKQKRRTQFEQTRKDLNFSQMRSGVNTI